MASRLSQDGEVPVHIGQEISKPGGMAHSLFPSLTESRSLCARMAASHWGKAVLPGCRVVATRSTLMLSIADHVWLHGHSGVGLSRYTMA